jgi:hypothetical protein
MPRKRGGWAVEWRENPSAKRFTVHGQSNLTSSIIHGLFFQSTVIRIRRVQQKNSGKAIWTMGGVCGSKPDGQYNNSSSQKLAQQLGIDDRTLTRLERVFQAIDFDGSGVSN